MKGEIRGHAESKGQILGETRVDMRVAGISVGRKCGGYGMPYPAKFRMRKGGCEGEPFIFFFAFILRSFFFFFFE